MPRPFKKERIRCRYFTWLLGKRGDVYVADGRSNTPSLGRPSLWTRDRDEALRLLHELDLTMAVQHGLADPSQLDAVHSTKQLLLAEGRRLYEEHIRRPQVVGGPCLATAKRYKSVLDKFLDFAARRGLACWNDVNRRFLEAYAAHLEGQDTAYSTQYLEVTTLLQVLKFLVAERHLPPECRVTLPMRRPDGTNTYCWSPEEVEAMLAHCAARNDLRWLRPILVALACTGLRISELISLRRMDIDFARNVIVLADESTVATRRAKRPVRTTKGRRSRTFPIHDLLGQVLADIPPSRDALVFHGPHGEPLEYDMVRQALIRDVLAPLAAKFPTPDGETGFADGRLHSFRHYFCSTCANSNVAERVVKTWLGHQDSRMIRRYYHLLDDEAQRQMGRVQFVSDSGGRSAG